MWRHAWIRRARTWRGERAASSLKTSCLPALKATFKSPVHEQYQNVEEFTGVVATCKLPTDGLGSFACVITGQPFDISFECNSKIAQRCFSLKTIECEFMSTWSTSTTNRTFYWLCLPTGVSGRSQQSYR